MSGQVTDAKTGKPIEPLSANDVVLVPPPLEPNVAGTFKLKFYSWLGPSGEIEFPRLAVSHTTYGPDNIVKVRYESDNIDLNPGASNDVAVIRTGHSIEIKQIPLQVATQEYRPPAVALQQVPYAAETSSSPPEPHQ